jgi:hypothetical protein
VPLPDIGYLIMRWRQMATLRINVYGPVPGELDRLRTGDVPRWARRLYGAYGYQVDDAPLSRSFQALGEDLRLRLKGLAVLLARAEELGWLAQVEADHVLLHTGLEQGRSEELLEEAGVLTVARALGRRNDRGELGASIAPPSGSPSSLSRA